MGELIRLAEAVERATPDIGGIALVNLEDEVKAAVWKLGIPPRPFLHSLDAAMALVPEGWHVGMLTECGEDDFPAACLTENEEPCRDAVGKGVNMTLSLVAAALRAREEDRG